MTTTVPAAVDTADLECKVKEMYTQVALAPEGDFHFEMGRAMARRLGYLESELDAVPSAAVQSFAGVGYYFDMAGLRPNECIVDLGSRSGMDSFIAANKVGSGGQVIGIDMTDAQLAKARRLADEGAFSAVRFHKGFIDATQLPAESCDVVISNGVINLAADKVAVFLEAARLLKRNGRLAISDIVTDLRLPETISCDATLWAACIGGAMQRDEYVDVIERAGFKVTARKENDRYRFLSNNAQRASRKYGVRSVSLLAVKR
jgi:ubiquinone/menaquinone biosynthesis C-methylase UbiE